MVVTQLTEHLYSALKYAGRPWIHQSILLMSQKCKVFYYTVLAMFYVLL